MGPCLPAPTHCPVLYLALANHSQTPKPLGLSSGLSWIHLPYTAGFYAQSPSSSCFQSQGESYIKPTSHIENFHVKQPLSASPCPRTCLPKSIITPGQTLIYETNGYQTPTQIPKEETIWGQRKCNFIHSPNLNLIACDYIIIAPPQT